MSTPTISRTPGPSIWPDRDSSSGADVRSQIVRAAMQAPSVHNTQPWLFTSYADGLDLHGDQSRQLPVLDPEGRQLHLSCGAALLNAQVAARGFGLTARTQLLPDPDDPTHLARLRLTAGAPANGPEQGLADAITRRHTYRDAFDPQPLSGALLDRLRAAAEAQGAYLHVLSDPDALLVLQCVLDRADRTQNNDPAYGRELGSWVHTGPADDGIPTFALPVDAQRGSSLRLREFAPAADLSSQHPSSRPSGADDPPVAERPDVVVIVCDDDTPLSWLVAGKALEAVMLQAAREGVMGQPLSQATDLPGSRPRLHAALGLVGTPQLALRLGYANGVAATPRRAVTDVLDNQASRAPVTAIRPLHDAALQDVRLGVWESEGGRLAEPGTGTAHRVRARAPAGETGDADQRLRRAPTAAVRTEADDGRDSDSERISRAAEELLRRGRHGEVMTAATARYGKFELALLLRSVAQALDDGKRLPRQLLRRAANLSRHILNHPSAPPG